MPPRRRRLGQPGEEALLNGGDPSLQLEEDPILPQQPVPFSPSVTTRQEELDPPIEEPEPPVTPTGIPAPLPFFPEDPGAPPLEPIPPPIEVAPTPPPAPTREVPSDPPAPPSPPPLGPTREAPSDQPTLLPSNRLHQSGFSRIGSPDEHSGLDRDAFLSFVTQNYDPTPDGLQRLVNDANAQNLPWSIPNLNSGVLDFGNGTVLDVIENQGAPYAEWHWLLLDDDAGQGDGADPGAVPDPSPDPVPSVVPDTDPSAAPREDMRQDLFSPTPVDVPGIDPRPEAPSPIDTIGDPGIYEGLGPVQQVGQDPLSELIDARSADLLQTGLGPRGQDVMGALNAVIQDSATPVGGVQLQQLISNILAGEDLSGQVSGLGGPSGEALTNAVTTLLENRGVDPTVGNLRFERARELTDLARQASLNQAQEALAQRGLASVPGIPQGQEGGAIRRIEERIAPEFAAAVRDILIDENERADQRLFQGLTAGTNIAGLEQNQFLDSVSGALELAGLNDARLNTSLSLATGLSEVEARTMLDSLGTATERQAVLSDIAIRSLDQNMEWNRFLAEYALERATTLETLQSGRLNDVQQILTLFGQFLDVARTGQVE